MKQPQSASAFIVSASLLVAGLALGLAGPAVQAQSKTQRERYTGIAVQSGAYTQAGATYFEIVIDRWSPDEEGDRLHAALKAKGPEYMLDTMVKFRPVAHVGQKLFYFSQKTVGAEGAEHIMLVTERWRSYEETVTHPLTYDYVFAIINLDIKADGTGSGTLTPATKITADPDGRFIVAENYDTSAIQLKDMKRAKP